MIVVPLSRKFQHEMHSTIIDIAFLSVVNVCYCQLIFGEQEFFVTQIIHEPLIDFQTQI